MDFQLQNIISFSNRSTFARCELLWAGNTLFLRYSFRSCPFIIQSRLTVHLSGQWNEYDATMKIVHTVHIRVFFLLCIKWKPIIVALHHAMSVHDIILSLSAAIAAMCRAFWIDANGRKTKTKTDRTKNAIKIKFMLDIRSSLCLYHGDEFPI